MMRRCLLLGLMIAMCCFSFAGPRLFAPARAADSKNTTPFGAFVDSYFDAYFAWKPSEGTAAGFHQYDKQLEDRSAAAIARRIEAVKDLQAKLAKIREAKLSFDEDIDAVVLDGQIQAELLDLETLHNWRNNPMGYISVPSSAIDGLMKRNFAPPAERLRSVIARLKQAPAVFQALRANVDNPPKEFTDLSIRIAKGTVGYFKDTLAAWAKEAAGNDQALQTEFAAANASVIRELAELSEWLEKDLLPRSKGKYAIGADNFGKQLLFEELVDIPLPKLLEVAEATLHRDQARFAALAKQIDPHKTPAEVMKLISDDHPTEEDLIPSARRMVERIRQYLVDKHIVTVPSEVRPTITETPPYARDGGFASMDTPGAYETKATEAFYYITPVEKDWDAKHKEEHLRSFSKPVMEIITIHEAFPGHYIQFLYAKQYPTKTRKLTYCGSNVEGWAHYTEQMMVEEGFGNGDPKIQMAQLEEALLRDCRFVVGIKLHTQGMTV
ncbi:MAG TPA: DUF885 domain-containing protein, partial [Gemmataceae bacterium]|nr:DUF885 domain-containing protein [Gemmataceae bacterium]